MASMREDIQTPSETIEHRGWGWSACSPLKLHPHPIPTCMKYHCMDWQDARSHSHNQQTKWTETPSPSEGKDSLPLSGQVT